MGNSIVLDPYDVYRLTSGLNCRFEDLLINKLDLNVVEGIILPNLKMSGRNESCAFLDEEGRCSIHSIRPGICRIFPLGRIYEDGSFQYFSMLAIPLFIMILRSRGEHSTFIFGILKNSFKRSVAVFLL